MGLTSSTSCSAAAICSVLVPLGFLRLSCIFSTRARICRSSSRADLEGHTGQRSEFCTERLNIKHGQWYQSLYTHSKKCLKMLSVFSLVMIYSIVVIRNVLDVLSNLAHLLLGIMLLKKNKRS